MQDTKKRVEEAGGRCFLLAKDLRTQKACHEVVETVLREMGAIDILVNNAGTQTMIDDTQNLSDYARLPAVAFPLGIRPFGRRSFPRP